MVEIRKRSLALAGKQGSQFHLPSSTWAYSALNSTSKYMEDVVGNRQAANYLFLDIRSYESVGTISGQASAFPVYRYDSWPYFSQGDWSHIGAGTTAPSLDDVVTRLIADSNPSKPTVSVPVDIAQLKDLPFSLRRAGILKGKGGRAENISGTPVDFNFGWDLLYRDVARMFNFAQDVDDRVKQLTAARSVNGASKQAHFWSDHMRETQSGLTVWSLEGSVVVDVEKTTTRSMWGSVNWKADDPQLPSATEILNQARRIVHGWRISPADVWELIPWSWFIDYFVNVGDYLEATTNSLGVHPERSCVMLHTDTRVIHTITSHSSYYTVTPASYRYETKERFPRTASLALRNVPLLGPKQLVTLSSIIQSFSGY